MRYAVSCAPLCLFSLSHGQFSGLLFLTLISKIVDRGDIDFKHI